MVEISAFRLDTWPVDVDHQIVRWTDSRPSIDVLSPGMGRYPSA